MKLFKITALLLCFGFISNGISFGQSQSGEYKQVTEALQLTARTSNKINEVSFYFCNSGLEYEKLTTFLEINIRPGETQEICTVFANKSDEIFGIIDGFTTGKISKPSDKVYDILCETNITGKNTFSDLIQGGYENEFTLLGKEVKIKKFSIKIPKNMTGSIYSCKMFKIKGNLQKAASGSMFNIEAVKKMPVQINITGNVYHYGLLETITDNKQSLLKGFMIIIGLWLIVSIIQSSSKKKHQQSHKK
ncbi:MAG: hypothetical protein WAZ12_01940 [Candidatus Absconditicoccaceae bacterium]